METAPLFACTKCHGRFPFDDLSEGDQLCKECRSNFPVVKCTYCRAEFQLNSKNSTTTICSKCAQNVKAFGKPTACEYCSILAAFIGKRCQRCVNSEKKWGPPSTCQQCKLRCAFDRSEESKGKVDGKQLCWLCTQAYKRVLAKTRKSQDFTLSMIKKSTSSSSLHEAAASGGVGDNSLENRISRLTSQSERGGEGQGSLAAAIMRMASSNTKPIPGGGGGGGGMEADASGSGGASSATERVPGPNGHNHHRHHHHHHHRHSKSRSQSDKSAHAASGEEGKEDKTRLHKPHHHQHGRHHHSKQSSQPVIKEETGEASPAKKPKIEKSIANGVSVSTPKSTGSNVSDAGMVDTSNSDNVILITQLREQIESLKKQLQSKDAQLLEKDKRISELKVDNYEADKEARLKITNMQKQHEDAISNLQVKNRELQKQVTKLSKGVKKSVLESIMNS